MITRYKYLLEDGSIRHLPIGVDEALSAEIVEYFEERAAIFEHDGGASRESAERDAARITAARFDVSVEFVRSITQG